MISFIDKNDKSIKNILKEYDFEVLVEDKSGSIVVYKLLAEFLKECYEIDSSRIHIHPHRGCGHENFNWDERPSINKHGLLFELPAKLRAYSSLYRPNNKFILIVIMDADNHSGVYLKEKLSQMCSLYAPEIPCVKALAVEELEAWLLADEQAIAKAYPNYRKNLYPSYIQDSICGTWEFLCKLVEDETIIKEIFKEANDQKNLHKNNYGYYKYQWAFKISRFLSWKANVSPSFKVLINDLTTVISKL